MEPVLFFSYSHKDEGLRDALETQLTSLKHQKLISTWHDRRISAGSHIDQVIDSNMESSQVILLLVSPDFISSDYCYNREVQRALERHNEGTATVIPVILRPCDWQDLSFGKLKATPRDGKPITTWKDSDQAFYDVIKSIKTVIKTLPTRKLNPNITQQVVASPSSLSRSDNAHVDRGDHTRNFRVALHGGMEDDVAKSPVLRAKLMELYAHLLREMKRRSISINYCGREPLRTVIYDCLKHGFVENDYLSGLIEDDPLAT